MMRVSIALNNRDLCKKSNTEHVCAHPTYGHDCTPTECAVNKKQCNHFETLKFVVRAYKTHRIQEINKLNEFQKKIAPCPLPKRSELFSSHVCLSHANCQSKNRFKSFFKYISPKVCSMCKGKLAYTCDSGRYVCSLNKKECDHYQKIANKNEKIVKPLRKCDKWWTHLYIQKLEISFHIK